MSNLKKTLHIHRIDYETDDAIWRANVLAKDIPDMIDYIRKFVGKPIKVNNTETRDSVHAVTDYSKEVLRELLEDDDKKKKEEHEKKTMWKCPWCESDEYSYESSHALKMHIVKKHAESKNPTKPKNRPRTRSKTKVVDQNENIQDE